MWRSQERLFYLGQGRSMPEVTADERPFYFVPRQARDKILSFCLRILERRWTMDFRILLEKITPALRYVARKHLLDGFYDEEDLFQEMCLYLWQHYGNGLPIGINESYAIKGCEFHIQNFLRKGRQKVMLSSLDELISPEGLTLGDILEDKKETFSSRVENKLTVDEIKSRLPRRAIFYLS